MDSELTAEYDAPTGQIRIKRPDGSRVERFYLEAGDHVDDVLVAHGYVRVVPWVSTLQRTRVARVVPDE